MLQELQAINGTLSKTFSIERRFYGDGHLHLVAAPGPTTLWESNLSDALVSPFMVTIQSAMGGPDYPGILSDESQAEQLISQDSKHPKPHCIPIRPLQRHEPSRRSITKLRIPMTRQRLKYLISKVLISYYFQGISLEPFV